MAKKKGKQSNTPRRKSFRRDQRLQTAKSWVPTYEGKNIFRGYRKRYGADWPAALRELEMVGVVGDAFPTSYRYLPFGTTVVRPYLM